MTRTARRLLAVLGGVAAAMALTAPAASASTSTCHVRNAATGAYYGSLSRAITAAAPGAKLVVAGRCTGNFAIDKPLTLASRYFGDQRAVLDGGGTGRVVSVGIEVPVTMTDFVITNGAGGVVNFGSLKLVRSRVTGNTAANSGGGIQNGGDLILTRSVVSHNRSGFDGGGIFNFGSVVTWASVISDNYTVGVGGGMFSEGIATLNNSLVTRNVATDAGGGILTVNTLVLNNTRVVGNLPDDCPGC